MDAAGDDAGWQGLWRKLVPGQVVAVFYEDDNTWHERLLLYPVNERVWVCATPDGDQYLEQLDGKDKDGVCRLCLLQTNGTAPRFLRGHFYRFAERFDDAKLRAMIKGGKAQADGMGDEVEPSWAINSAGEKLKYKVYMADSSGKGFSSMDLSKGKAEADEDLDAGEDHVWVSLETVGAEIKKGQELSLISGDVRLGDRGIHILGSGESVAVQRLTVEEAADQTDEKQEGKGDKLDDLRLFSPVCHNSAGKRWLDFGKGVDKISQEVIDDWPLEGDRSIAWLVGYIHKHGGTPEGRHTKWAVEQHIGVDSLGYVLHDLVGYCLELAVSYDQLDVSNLASCEVLGRIYQLLEETSGTMVVEGLEHYIGRSKTGGRKKGVALAPGLAKSVTASMSAETEILKQRRKAREEEQSARETSKKSGPKGGAGGK